MPHPKDIPIRIPGGHLPQPTFASETRRIIGSFEGEQFQAIHVISELRATDIKHLKVRSDSALRSGVRKEIAKLIDNGRLRIIRPPNNNVGEKVAGIYQEVRD